MTSLTGYTGPTGPMGPKGKAERIGLEGPTGPQGDGIALNPVAGTGTVLVNNPDGSTGIYYTNILNIDNINITSQANIIPNQNNTLSLGSTDLRWKEIFMGPGTLNIASGVPNVQATLGANNSGIIYTESGFATPFINQHYLLILICKKYL